MSTAVEESVPKVEHESSVEVIQVQNDQTDANLGKRDTHEDDKSGSKKGSKKNSERKNEEDAKSTHKQGQSQENNDHGKQDHAIHEQGSSLHKKAEFIVTEETHTTETTITEEVKNGVVTCTEVTKEEHTVDTHPQHEENKSSPQKIQAEGEVKPDHEDHSKHSEKLADHNQADNAKPAEDVTPEAEGGDKNDSS